MLVVGSDVQPSFGASISPVTTVALSGGMWVWGLIRLAVSALMAVSCCRVVRDSRWARGIAGQGMNSVSGHRGMDQLVFALEDVMRGCELGAPASRAQARKSRVGVVCVCVCARVCVRVCACVCVRVV